jgi:hypothetical protein
MGISSKHGHRRKESTGVGTAVKVDAPGRRRRHVRLAWPPRLLNPGLALVTLSGVPCSSDDAPLRAA